MTSSVFPALVGLLVGLAAGSFLNVVIHRLPRMMERQWQRDIAQWHAERAEEDGSHVGSPARVAQEEVYNLAFPPSHCPGCGHAVRWYENNPVLSYLFLRGRCSSCGMRIGWRYLAVELATAMLFAACLARWGLTPTGWLWCGFSAALLALALIDLDTQYLPDDLTQPLLWSALVAAGLGWNPWVTLEAALWGAVAGYLSLWLIYHAFKRVTGKEGMGYGDFKLLAALGAWFGWPALLPIVLLASISGAVLGLAQRVLGRLAAGQPMPFGPYLAAAGFLALWLGPQGWWPVLVAG